MAAYVVEQHPIACVHETAAVPARLHCIPAPSTAVMHGTSLTGSSKQRSAQAARLVTPMQQRLLTGRTISLKKQKT